MAAHRGWCAILRQLRDSDEVVLLDLNLPSGKAKEEKLKHYTSAEISPEEEFKWGNRPSLVGLAGRLGEQC